MQIGSKSILSLVDSIFFFFLKKKKKEAFSNIVFVCADYDFIIRRNGCATKNVKSRKIWS